MVRTPGLTGHDRKEGTVSAAIDSTVVASGPGPSEGLDAPGLSVQPWPACHHDPPQARPVSGFTVDAAQSHELKAEVPNAVQHAEQACLVQFAGQPGVRTVGFDAEIVEHLAGELTQRARHDDPVTVGFHAAPSGYGRPA